MRIAVRKRHELFHDEIARASTTPVSTCTRRGTFTRTHARECTNLFAIVTNTVLCQHAVDVSFLCLQVHWYAVNIVLSCILTLHAIWRLVSEASEGSMSSNSIPAMLSGSVFCPYTFPFFCYAHAYNLETRVRGCGKNHNALESS